MTATIDDLASPDHVCAAERCTGFGDPACGCACHTMEHFLFGGSDA